VFVGRLHWKKEDENESGDAAAATCKIEEDKLNQAETMTKEIRTEENKKICGRGEEFQSKAPPRCPHLFMRQKPTHSTS
jgi:hypothetical protein